MSYPANTGNKIPKGYSYGQFNRFTPEMQNIWNQMYGHIGPESYLSKLAGGDEGTFGEIEAPAKKQFSQTLSGIGNRFSAAGMGAQKSSGFQNATSQAASDFAQQLQANRHQLKQQALMDMMNISNSLLNQNPYEQFLIKNQNESSGWAPLLGTAGGAMVGGYFGGPKGALSGAKIGQQAFGGF